ncbi:CBS domain-containing protein [Embleya sp. NBC_00896]|uniref:CBS domain-containing protein n=1 Tax=Embleya sp. NBC_00896 TaxID=2975961 RepID=UPI0038638080|nr:CBS domain-containing protein [Embleya sp. NBC_00896]
MDESRQAQRQHTRIPLVREVMHAPIVAVTVDDTLWTAMDAMFAANLHHLAVVDGGRAVGLISDRDLAALWALDPLGLKRRTAGRIAGPERPFVASDADALDAGEHMLRHAMDAVLVVDAEQRPVGVLTDHDLLGVFVNLHRVPDAAPSRRHPGMLPD